MTPLEMLLADAGTTLEWPETPDLATQVRARIEAGGVRARAPRRFRLRRPLVIALASLLLLAATAAAIPGIRDPILDFLGLRSVKIERVPSTPVLPARAPGNSVGLGDRVTFARARRDLGFFPLLPRYLGRPVIYVDPFIPGGRVALVYRNGNLLVSEWLGTLRREYLEKMIPPGTRIERLTLGGDRALWIHGDDHGIVYLDENGHIRPEEGRLSGPALLVRHGSMLLRVEGARDRAEAIRIARAALASR